MEELLIKTIYHLLDTCRIGNEIDDDVLDHMHGIVDGFIAAYTQTILDIGYDVEFQHTENNKCTSIKVNGITYQV